MEDAARHPAFPEVALPTLIFHGTRDDTVDPAVSRRYAAERPEVTLRLVDSDHGLGDAIQLIIGEALSFLAPWLTAG